VRAYAFLGAAQLGYQSDVVQQLRARGVDVEPLVEGSLDDLEAIAAAGPALLFLCGLPYTRLRDAGFAVEPLVAPAIGDGPPTYTSTLLGRRGAALAALEHAHLAINHRPSMSGWVLPVSAGLPLERFERITETGSHRRSLEMLLAGEADAAPIDSHLLAAEMAVRPELRDLPVLADYGPSPSPPIVLVDGDAEQAASLRAILAGLPLHHHVDRLAPVDDAFYDPTRESDRRAALCTR
jgi:ABC-type phosphate/phosphonate transport system substrate-binding protein